MRLRGRLSDVSNSKRDGAGGTLAGKLASGHRRSRSRSRSRSTGGARAVEHAVEESTVMEVVQNEDLRPTAVDAAAAPDFVCAAVLNGGVEMAVAPAVGGEPPCWVSENLVVHYTRTMTTEQRAATRLVFDQSASIGGGGGGGAVDVSASSGASGAPRGDAMDISRGGKMPSASRGVDDDAMDVSTVSRPRVIERRV